MKTTEYLYGCEIGALPSMEAGLVARIEKAEKLLSELIEIPLTDRDWARINAVYDSISHNNKILKGAI